MKSLKYEMLAALLDKQTGMRKLSTALSVGVGEPGVHTAKIVPLSRLFTRLLK